MRKPKIGVLLFALAGLTGLLLPIPSFAGSQARIVRLSDVQGDVQIDRNTGQGFEKAFLNLPITQGVQLRARDGFAEVEFEDGSALRITPGTSVAFPQLELRDSGGRASTVNVKQGTAYVKFAGAKDDELTLTFGSETLTLNSYAHLRVQMGHIKAMLSVFKGDVRVGGPAGMVEVGKKESATFELADPGQYTLAKNVPELSSDAWDKEQDEYHQRNLTTTALSTSPYAYGISDLNYYGNFFDVPGYGTMWQPYLMGANWDPFMNGLWASYPGAGFGWVSAYPWGWTPYHSGSWMFLPNYGWAWQPGGSWTGLNNLPVAVNSPAGFATPRPPVVPVRGLVVVNRGPALTPGVTPAGKILVRSGSAGLGVPRGSIDNLSKVSQHAQSRGFAAAYVSTRPTSTVMFNPRPSAIQSGPVTGFSPGTGAPAASARQSAPAPAFRPSAPMSAAPSAAAPSSRK